MASFALHVCPMSVLHLFPQPHISVWMYLPAVSSVIARSFLFLAGHTPTHPSILRSEATSSILMTLFHHIIPLVSCFLKSMLTSSSAPTVAVASISAGNKLCWSSALYRSAEDHCLLTESGTLGQEQAFLIITTLILLP